MKLRNASGGNISVVTLFASLTMLTVVAPQVVAWDGDVEIYKSVEDIELTVELFTPEAHAATDRRPAAIFFFGGGWKGGSPDQFKPHCRYLASRGMVAMVADYRVESRHGATPFECVADAKSAIRWVRANAERLGIDADKIAAGGGSAGGHLAAATATIEGLNDDQDDLSVSAIPNALLLFNPVYDNGPEGYGFDRIGDRYPEISPLHNIRAGIPPTIVFLGTNDRLIPVSTAEAFQEAAEAVGGRHDLHLYAGQPHGFFNQGRSRQAGSPDYYVETVVAMDDFLNSIGFLTGTATLSSDAYQLVENGEESIDLLHEGRTLARLMIGFDRSTPERIQETYKPYLHVLDAAGESEITKGPGGQFPHHRGIFLGYNRLGFDGATFDLWHMRDTVQVHTAIENKWANDEGVGFDSIISWQTDAGRQILDERRSLSLRSAPDGAYALIQMTSELTATHGAVRLSGDPEHAGAQFRPANEVVRENTVYHFHESGIDPKEDRDLPWVGETFQIGDRKFTVVILNHPSNPDQTIYSAYRDYGRFGAYPEFSIEAGESRTLMYQWIIAEGEMISTETVESALAAFSAE